MSHGAEAVAKPHGSFIRTLLGHSSNRVATVTVAYCHRARAGATDGRLWSGDSNVHTWRSKGGRIHITRCSALPVNYFYSGPESQVSFQRESSELLHRTWLPDQWLSKSASEFTPFNARPQHDITASLVKAPHCIFTKLSFFFFEMENNLNNLCIWGHILLQTSTDTRQGAALIWLIKNSRHI